LDQCALKYGGVLKDAKIREYWDEGVQTENIPAGELRPYLVSDVENTELVFSGQMELIKTLKLLPLARTQMSGLKATVEMEHNGMYFDKEQARKLGVHCEADMCEAAAEVKELLSGANCYNPYFVQEFFNINSAQDVSTALVGGDYEYKIKVDELDADGMPRRFKSGINKGEIKQTWKAKMKHTDGLGVTPDPAWETPSGKMGVGSAVLKDIGSSRNGVVVSEFVKLVLERRSIAKDYKTYYIGYSDLTWTDACIHPSLSHVGTDTGRLSCSKPNLQNATQTEDH